MQNRVKHLRRQKKLSQRKLAELVGTSQQQIQRIETGQVAARLGIAQKLSTALQQPLDVIFPGSRDALSRIEHIINTSRTILEDELSEAEKFGIEADFRTWHFRVLVQHHSEPFVFGVSGVDKRRPSAVGQTIRCRGIRIFKRSVVRLLPRAPHQIYRQSNPPCFQDANTSNAIVGLNNVCGITVEPTFIMERNRSKRSTTHLKVDEGAVAPPCSAYARHFF